MIRCFLVEGGSMKPLLHSGDLVLAVGLRGNPRTGDIIVYREGHSGFLVVHRVEGIVSSGVKTKGDANLATDPLPVTQEQILGRVRWVTPRLGRLLTLLRKG